MCLNCRESDHHVAECPKLNAEGAGSGKSEQSPGTAIGICFKCGSTEHAIYQCKKKIMGMFSKKNSWYLWIVVRNSEFDFLFKFRISLAIIDSISYHMKWEIMNRNRLELFALFLKISDVLKFLWKNIATEFHFKTRVKSCTRKIYAMTWTKGDTVFISKIRLPIRDVFRLQATGPLVEGLQTKSEGRLSRWYSIFILSYFKWKKIRRFL